MVFIVCTIALEWIAAPFLFSPPPTNTNIGRFLSSFHFNPLEMGEAGSHCHRGQFAVLIRIQRTTMAGMEGGRRGSSPMNDVAAHSLKLLLFPSLLGKFRCCFSRGSTDFLTIES